MKLSQEIQYLMPKSGNPFGHGLPLQEALDPEYSLISLSVAKIAELTSKAYSQILNCVSSLPENLAPTRRSERVSKHDDFLTAKTDGYWDENEE
jgi:hypothetical protein